MTKVKVDTGISFVEQYATVDKYLEYSCCFATLLFDCNLLKLIHCTFSTEKCDVFTLEACAKMAESLEKVLAGFVDFVMVSWVIYYLDIAVYGYQTIMK